MASSKKYPSGQKPAALPAKPTMAQAFNAAQGPAVNRPTGSSAIGATGMPGKVGPLMGKSNSFPNVASAVKAAVKAISNSRPANPSSAIGATGMPNAKPAAKPVVKPIPPKELSDVTEQAKAKDRKANTARMTKDLATGVKVVKKAASSSSTSTAKPYVKLKQPAREEARRAFVQKRLEKLGIKPAAAGKPRSAAEKAARAKARATWDKKNKFVPKANKPGPTENRPEM